MEYRRIRIKIVNPNEKMIREGMDKILILINKQDIEDYFDFINILNEYLKTYGKVDRLMDKEGYLILKNNNMNFWNYINDNEEILVKLKANKNEIITKTITLIKEENLDSESSESEEESESKKISVKQKKSNYSNNNKSNEQNNIKIEEKNLNIEWNENDNINENNEQKQYLNKKRNPKIKNTENKNKNKNKKKNKNKNNSIKKNKNLFNEIFNESNNKENQNEEKSLLLNNINESNFIQIPSDKLDDIEFLTQNYPLLFKTGTLLKFKIQEMDEDGICIGNYRIGKIEDYSEENNSFLIQIENQLEGSRKLIMYENEENELYIQMKNFIEIWIYDDSNSVKNKEIKETNSQLIYDFLKRQIEYYFSDLNYEKDSYLKSKEDENRYIDLDILMQFNKIKMMTQDKKILIKALKEQTDKIEFNDDYTKIRKKIIE